MQYIFHLEFEVRQQQKMDRCCFCLSYKLQLLWLYYFWLDFFSLIIFFTVYLFLLFIFVIAPLFPYVYALLLTSFVAILVIYVFALRLSITIFLSPISQEHPHHTFNICQRWVHFYMCIWHNSTISWVSSLAIMCPFGLRNQWQHQAIDSLFEWVLF